MQAKYIPYTTIRPFSTLIMDYLSQKESLPYYFQYAPTLEGFDEKLKAYSFSGNREILVQVLEKQYESATPNTLIAENITALKSENTFTITTGHQLNIFTGPLYFIFKICSTIKLCRDLKEKYPDKNFVPIYWMATEDHDFEEINHTYIEDKKIVWDIPSAGITGDIDTTSIQKTLTEYEHFLSTTDDGKALAQMMHTAYSQGNNLATATRNIVHSLFAQYGLVIVDANDKALKAQFAPIILQDIIGQNSFKNIENTNRELEKLQYDIQVQPREINFFYIDKNIRERIVFENNTYKVLNTNLSFTAEELEAKIKNYPEHFSPNVVMRPLYQELILPNLAYIGGGGEIAYWLQLKSNFDFYHIDFPILILRNSALIADAISVKNIHQLKLEWAEIFAPLHQLQREWVMRNSAHKLQLKDEKDRIETLISYIQQQSSNVDVTLHCSAESMKVKIQKLLDNFEKKILRAEKRNFEDRIRQLSKLKNNLFPNGVLQERKLNVASFYKIYGASLIDDLIAHFEPLSQNFTLLVPNS